MMSPDPTLVTDLLAEVKLRTAERSGELTRLVASLRTMRSEKRKLATVREVEALRTSVAHAMGLIARAERNPPRDRTSAVHRAHTPYLHPARNSSPSLIL